MKQRLLYLARLPFVAWRLVWQRVIPTLFYLASFLRSPRQAVSVWPEAGFRIGPRVAVFVHFDASGALRPYVRQYLSALRETGLDIVFVTNAGRLQDEAMAFLKEFCAGVIVRRNVGYDFGALREAIERVGLPRADTEMVVLANDSVYGPLHPLKPLIERIDFNQADLWGMTESWQTRFHLQSYFLAFGRAALTSPTWRTFWNQVRPVSSKWWVILHYELGLTEWFVQAGFRTAALWGYQDLLRQVRIPDPATMAAEGAPDDDGFPAMLDPMQKSRAVQARYMRGAVAGGIPLNPTTDLWRQLLEAGFPFLKRELLRINPTGVGDLADWRDVVKQTTGADIGPIERDIRRGMRNRAA